MVKVNKNKKNKSHIYFVCFGRYLCHITSAHGVSTFRPRFFKSNSPLYMSHRDTESLGDLYCILYSKSDSANYGTIWIIHCVPRPMKSLSPLSILMQISKQKYRQVKDHVGPLRNDSKCIYLKSQI